MDETQLRLLDVQNKRIFFLLATLSEKWKETQIWIPSDAFVFHVENLVFE